MRRQLSARLENALLDSTYHRGRTENNVVRFSSTGFLSRTRPLSLICQHHHQHQNDQRQPKRKYDCYYIFTRKKPICFFFRRDRPSFDGLRACYFSNAVERTHNDNHASSQVDDSMQMNTRNCSDQISTQLAHLFVEKENPNKFNYVKTLKSWYLDNHGESGSAVQDAFVTKMIQNPNSHHVVSAIKDLDEDLNINDVVVVDGTIRQIFTASFTCPLTNERFEAGRLTGYYDVENQNFYSRKKVAIQAVSAIVLRHKTNANDNDNYGGVDFGGSDTNTNSDAKYSKQLNNDQSTFRQILQRLYMKHFKVSPTQSQSSIIKQDFFGKLYGGTWWTAEFTCPITGRIYEAADLPSEVVPDSMKIKKAGQIWYRKKTDSIHASASNAIESIDWNAELHILKEENSKSNSRELEKSTNNNEDLEEILRPLLSWYVERGHDDSNCSIDDDFVVTGGSDSRNDDVGHKLWTASFVCPLTGERFDSGTINATDAIYHTEINTLIWYTKKNAAIQAASQRAYDVFKYRHTGVNDPRFCKEDPSQHTTEAFDISTTVQGENDSFYVDYEVINGNELTNQCDHTFEEDEDNFVIEVIPQQINQSLGSYCGSSKTLDAIAQAWIDSTGVSTDKEISKYGIENFQNAFSEREKAICRALEWVSRQDKKTDKPSSDRTQFDIKSEICNLKIANVILSALAECHQRVPFDSQSIGVEECAAAILESMWSSHSTKPDAQSYAFYLKCLEGETPGDVIAKAQEIVNAMESGHDYNQRSLPKPNGAIHSSLFELKALSGRNSLMLETSNFGSLDRNTHLCKLSAMAHDLTTFDIDVATKLINEMRTLSETNDEPSLQPDIEVYNAPLRWSGGHQWSRLYSRVIPWDSYSEIYKDGFKSDSGMDEQRKHAGRVEQWIEIIKTKASRDKTLASNIETYESLIQAWVRCGNQESLLRAETIAKNILTGEYSGIQPRIQSFYPILAAWTYSGCKEGPHKVESWIDILQELVPNLEPRLSFPNISIMAQISLQRQILNRLNKPLDVTPSDMENCIFDSAMKCSKFLENTINRYKVSPDSQAQSEVFLLVINAWYNAGSKAILKDNLEETKMCCREIQKTVDQFDDLLVWLHQVDENNRAKTQFFELLNLAPSVYGAQQAALIRMERNLDKFQNVVSKDCDRTIHLISIEEKIRRLEEFHLFWGDDSNSIDDGTLKGKTGIDATSVFPSKMFISDLFCTRWVDYIDSSLDILEKGANDSSIGEPDFIRLSMLIARVTSNVMPAVLNAIAKDRIIDKIVRILEIYCGNNQDREAVISAVIQSLQKRPVMPESKRIRRMHPGESKDGTNDECYQEKDQETDIADIHAEKKVRREKAHRNGHYKSSYPRPKVLNRSWQRRSLQPRSYHAK